MSAFQGWHIFSQLWTVPQGGFMNSGWQALLLIHATNHDEVKGLVVNKPHRTDLQGLLWTCVRMLRPVVSAGLNPREAKPWVWM